MQAIGFTQPGPITAENALIALDVPEPQPRERDLIVEVRAVSVNPVDTKVRARATARSPERSLVPQILGYDAAGVVRAVGPDVQHYKPGDEVFYAGDITRPGTNAELHAVDERIVGRKPESLDFACAAGIPLTAITAWELLFDSLALHENANSHEGDSILVIGGAGGVGSILIQLARQLTGLRVIATASRPETVEWVRKMGADDVINHRESLVEQIATLNLDRAPKYVAALTATEQHLPAIIELIQPRGRIAIIDDPADLDINAGKLKSLSFHWEFMFARSMHQTADMGKQRELLNRVSAMLDAGDLVSTVTANLGPMSVETLIEAHKRQESGRVIGKNVLSGLA